MLVQLWVYAEDMNNTTNTNLTTMTPAQIDELLLELMREESSNSIDLTYAMYKATDLHWSTDTSASVVISCTVRRENRYEDSVKFFALRSDFDAAPETTTEYPNGHVSVGKRDSNRYLLSDAVAYLADKQINDVDAVKIVASQDTTVDGLAVKAIVERNAEIKNLIKAIDAEFNARGGWSRYFLVTSSTGHIHSSQSCHSCNKGKYATSFALVYAMSDLNAEVAVELLGPSLCSICFPNAPVEMTEQSKISASLASVYFDKGHDAFVAAKKIAEEKAAKRAAKKAVAC